MGKEIHKPTPKEFGRKISSLERVARIGLVPLALAAAFAFSEGCSPKSSPPRNPVGISDNSPQFPGTGNDRPLQNQRTPTATPTKERPTPTPAESPIEQEWKRFTSLNYPYQINYPEGWTATTTLFGGKQIDKFMGEISHNFTTNVNILSEQVNDWVTPKDYANNYLSQVQQFDKRALILQNFKVAGQDAYTIQSIIPEGAIFFNPMLSSTTTVFIKDGKAWQISLSIDYYASKESQRLTYDRFQEMLKSFKFLR